MRPSTWEARVCGRIRGIAAVVLAGALTVASACTVGPAYLRPSAPTAPVYKELDGWKTARPQDDVLRGPWWTVFEDPALSALEEQVSVANQTVIVSYLNVVSAQTTALADERAAGDILGRRMTASVLLIDALGGGWNAEYSGTAIGGRDAQGRTRAGG